MFEFKKKDGYVLMGALSMSVLMLVVGSASMYMISMGSQTVGSERQYEITRNAADYGLQKAIEAVTKSTEANPCTIASKTDLLPGKEAGYSYFTKSDANGNNCLVYSEGLDKVSYDNKIAGKSISGSRVVKTAIIPTKKVSGSSPGAVSAEEVKIFNFNSATKPAVGSNCGPAMLYETISQNAKNNIENAENIISGDPKTKQASVNTFDAIFGGNITDQAKLSAAIDSIIKKRAENVSDACKAIPPDDKINSTNCNSGTSGGKVVINCTGDYIKTIDISACEEVVISAGAMTISHDMKSTVLTVNTTNNLTFSGQNKPTAKGLLSTDGDLNINELKNTNASDRQTNALEGLFIGARANNLTMSGNDTIYGLVFIGSGNLAMNINGTDKVAGAIAVNGGIDFNRKGQGEDVPNIEFNYSKIEPWRNYYGTDFIESLSCNNGTPPSKKAMLENTKMSLF